MFNIGKEQFDKGCLISKWFTHVKNEIGKCGLPGIWNDRNLKSEQLKIVVNQILSDQFRQDWYDTINSDRRFKIYKRIKKSFKFESYFEKLPNYLAINFCRFRLGNLKTEFCKQRNFNNADYSPTTETCSFCKEDVYLNEFHYLMNCSHFSNSRRSLMSFINFDRPDILLFENIFNIQNSDKLYNISKFCQKILYALEEVYVPVSNRPSTVE